MAFWRRGKPSDARRGSQARDESGGGDELAQLQRQFGIKPVSDADVQSEFRALFGGGGGGALGLSPRSELLLLGGGGAGDGDDDDDEAAILRALNIRGVGDGPLDLDTLELSDDEDGSGDGGAAQRELGGVLRAAHATAARHHSQSDPLQLRAGDARERPEDVAARAHELKLQALALKREGKVKEALALFRQAKDLEAQAAVAAPASSRAAPTAVAPAPAAASATAGTGVYDAADGDGSDVEVTDEDMRDPEFLAQLAKLGLAGSDDPPERRAEPDTVASVEAQIQEAKLQALARKRSNDIQEALQWMRKVKELQATLEQLQSENVARAGVVTASSATIAVASREERHGSYTHSSDTVVVSHSYTSAALPADDSAAGTDLGDDVEVTEKDMEDPAFAAELLKLGFDPSEAGSDRETSAASKSGAEAVSLTPVRTLDVARVLQSALSIGDEDLIDEFDEVSDDDDDDGGVDSSDPPMSVLASSSTAPVGYTDALSVEPATPSAPSVSPAQASRELQDGIVELQAQLQHSKEAALRLKREGDTQGALEAMRRMKQIETLLEHKQKKLLSLGVTTTETTPPPVRDPESQARFQELEHALVDFGNRAFALAKETLSVDRAKATEWLNKRKEYAAALDELREKRKNHLQAPPSFKIDHSIRLVEVELADVPADQVFVTIHVVNDLPAALAGRDVFVKFCLNFPSSTPHEGKTSAVRVSTKPPYSTGKLTQQNRFRFPVQRSRGTQRLCEIKKANFEVWTAGTFLRNPELVARGYQELTPFLSVCQVNCRVPFVGSNRKPIGGDVEISIRFRTPLREKEMRSEIVEDLHVGEYPEPSQPIAASAPSYVTSAGGTSSGATVSPPAQYTPAAQVDELVSDDTEDDPHHPDLIISYDVINEELEKIEAKLPSLQGEAASELSDRFDSLALKKQLLEIEMETGKLTLDMYVAKLNARIRDDRQLMAKLLRSNRRMDAARVLHRIKVMEKELVGADGGSAEDAGAAPPS